MSFKKNITSRLICARGSKKKLQGSNIFSNHQPLGNTIGMISIKNQ